MQYDFQSMNRIYNPLSSWYTLLFDIGFID